MLPGPNLYFSCPDCHWVCYKPSLASGNTFGSVLWSDGFQYWPMLPRYENIARCENCRHVFRLDDESQIGELCPWDDEDIDDDDEFSLSGQLKLAAEKFGEIREIQDASFETLEIAFKQASSAEERKEIATRMWWLSSDPQRERQREISEMGDDLPFGYEGDPLDNEEIQFAGQPEKNELTGLEIRTKAIEYLESAIGDDDEHSKLMLAEAFRQSGRFDQAKTILKTIGPELSWVVSQMQSKIDEGYTQVFILDR